MEWDKIISAIIFILFTSGLGGLVVYNICGWISGDDLKQTPDWRRNQ